MAKPSPRPDCLFYTGEDNCNFGIGEDYFSYILLIFLGLTEGIQLAFTNVDKFRLLLKI